MTVIALNLIARKPERSAQHEVFEASGVLSDQQSGDMHGGWCGWGWGYPDPNWIFTLADFYFGNRLDVTRWKATYTAMTYHDLSVGVD